MVSCKLISRYGNIYRLGEAKESQTHMLYKYMNVQHAIDFLRTGKYYFVEPTAWSDPYEKRFYTADYDNVGYQPSKLFCTCLTSRISNEAAWKMYRGNHGGIAERTIRFDFKRSVLFKVLSEFNANFYFGCVNYTYTTNQIDGLHKKTNSEYIHLFNDFSDVKFMNLLLIKRKAFEYESEVRLFMRPNEREPIDSGMQLGCNYTSVHFDSSNLKDMIHQISIDPSCSDIEYEMIRSIIQQISSQLSCIKNTLYTDKPKITIE